MKVKCVDSIDLGKYLTFWKDYEVLREDDKRYYVIDDEGNSTGFFKERFEIIKEDKMEEIRVVRKLEDLHNLENGMGATAVYDEVNKRVRIRTKEECLGIGIAYSDEYSDLDGFLTVMKVIGFKFEYKPSRSLEEVVEEARTKIVEFVPGKSNYLLVKTLKGYVVDRDVYLERVGSLYLCKEQAQKYADELNEIIGVGK